MNFRIIFPEVRDSLSFLPLRKMPSSIRQEKVVVRFLIFEVSLSPSEPSDLKVVPDELFPTKKSPGLP